MTLTFDKPLTQPRKYTLEEFYNLDLPDNGSKYELLDGQLYINGELFGEAFQMAKPGPNWKHGSIVTKASRYLDAFITDQKLGRVYAGAACVPDPTKTEYIVPDVAFVLKERLVGQPEDGPIPVAPDLVVEVNSPTDKVEGIHTKIKDYQRDGVRLVWSVYPLDEFVLVYRLGQKAVAIYNLDDELDGGEVLPGFKLKVSTLFE